MDYGDHFCAMKLSVLVVLFYAFKSCLNDYGKLKQNQNIYVCTQGSWVSYNPYKMHADPQNIHILVIGVFHRVLWSEW